MSVEDRLQKVEVTLVRFDETHNRIADSLERLVRLETMHAETRHSVDRAFSHTEKIATGIDAKLESICGRLRGLEEKQPVVSLTVYFVGALVLGALAAVGAAVLKVAGWADAP